MVTKSDCSLLGIARQYNEHLVFFLANLASGRIDKHLLKLKAYWNGDSEEVNFIWAQKNRLVTYLGKPQKK